MKEINIKDRREIKMSQTAQRPPSLMNGMMTQQQHQSLVQRLIENTALNRDKNNGSQPLQRQKPPSIPSILDFTQTKVGTKQVELLADKFAANLNKTQPKHSMGNQQPLLPMMSAKRDDPKRESFMKKQQDEQQIETNNTVASPSIRIFSQTAATLKLLEQPQSTRTQNIGLQRPNTNNGVILNRDSSFRVKVIKAIFLQSQAPSPSNKAASLFHQHNYQNQTIKPNKTINLQTSALHKYQTKQQQQQQQTQNVQLQSPGKDQKRRNIQVFEQDIDIKIAQQPPIMSKKGKVIGFPATAAKGNSPTNMFNSNNRMSNSSQKQPEQNADMSHLYGSRLNQSSSQGFNRKMLSPYIIFNKNCQPNNHQPPTLPLSQQNEQLSANSSILRQTQRAAKNKGGYEGQLESYVGQLDGIKSLLTATVEKLGARKNNPANQGSNNMNLVGKTVQKPIFASPSHTANEIIEIQMDPELFHRLSNKLTEQKKPSPIVDVVEPAVEFQNFGNIEYKKPVLDAKKESSRNIEDKSPNAANHTSLASNQQLMNSLGISRRLSRIVNIGLLGKNNQANSSNTTVKPQTAGGKISQVSAKYVPYNQSKNNFSSTVSQPNLNLNKNIDDTEKMIAKQKISSQPDLGLSFSQCNEIANRSQTVIANDTTKVQDLVVQDSSMQVLERLKNESQNKYSKSFSNFTTLNQKMISRFLQKRHHRSTLSESQSTEGFNNHRRSNSNSLINKFHGREQIKTFNGSAFKSNNHYASQPYIATFQKESERSQKSQLSMLKLDQMKAQLSRSRESLRQVLSMSKVELSPDKGPSPGFPPRPLTSTGIKVPSLQQIISPTNKETNQEGFMQRQPSLLKMPINTLQKDQQKPNFSPIVIPIKQQLSSTPKIIGKQPEILKGRPIYLPKTGIEQPFMRHDYRFIRPKFDISEGIFTYESQGEKLMFIDQYKNKDTHKENIDFKSRLVYDSSELQSPFYPTSAAGDSAPNEYIRKEDLIPSGPIKPQVQGGTPINNYQSQNKSQSDANDPFGQEKVKLNLQNQKPQNNNNLNKFYQTLKPYYKLTDQKDETLIFESRFESGNLQRAIQIGPYTYDMSLKTDFGCTTNYTQWFFFKVSNTKKDQQYTFHITNFIKPDSLFSNGMKPLIYSKKQAELTETSWVRTGKDIVYYQTPPKQKLLDERVIPTVITQPLQEEGASNREQTLYTLSFKVNFQHDQDEVYFAYCYPYTYSDCLRFLDRISQNYQNRDILRRAPLCHTLAGNDVDMLIITNFASRPEVIAERPAIILTGRVHPGESNSSYIIEGVIEYLLSWNDEGAKQLRNRYVFKVVPMLNPDGVVIGNYRCSLSGQDLNRQWIAPNMRYFPEILACKQMIRKTMESRELAFYCDFHGHSRAKNSFMYGCNNQSKEKKNRERIFPLMFSRKCEEFSFEGSAFSIHKAKESTARVVLWKEYLLVNSFTLETSFCGSTKGPNKDTHFSIPQLLELGRKFSLTLVDFSELEFAEDYHKRMKVYIRDIEAILRGDPLPSTQENEEGQQQEEAQNTKASSNHALKGGLGLNSIEDNIMLNDGEPVQSRTAKKSLPFKQSSLLPNRSNKKQPPLNPKLRTSMLSNKKSSGRKSKIMKEGAGSTSNPTLSPGNFNKTMFNNMTGAPLTSAGKNQPIIIPSVIQILESTTNVLE